jgi:hypothetical protein
MPVYHISNFDVSAVQIDLSANIFTADDFSADYWIVVNVDFNEYNGGGIKSDTSLNQMFTNINQYIDRPVYATRPIGGRTTTFATAYATSPLLNIQFSDLGIIDKTTDTLFNGSIYNIGDLSANNPITYPLSFIGKVNTALQAITHVTGLRERMMASINATNNSDLGITQNVPYQSDFGFLVVRKVNFAGLSLDNSQTANIGVVLRQNV